VVPLAALVARWSEIAGDAVAAHARPLTLRDGVLVVAVDQPIWRTQLGFLEADVRRRVREVTGIEITELRVRVRSN
jgi:predicted nucleic acid-binding Zn ribbon protein